MSVKRVTPPQACELLEREGFVYLDVRSIPEFQQGHPRGAYNVPLMHFSTGRMQPNPEFLDVVKKTFAPETKIVVGCKSGGRSLRAVELLAQNGFTGVIDMRGGFGGELDPMGRCAVAGWADAGLPVSTTPGAGKSYDELRSK